MVKRAYKRISANIGVVFFSETEEYYGTIKNISEKGMFIHTRTALPLRRKLKILMPWHSDTLWLHATVRSSAASDGGPDGIGVELLRPSHRYLEFISCLRACGRL